MRGGADAPSSGGVSAFMTRNKKAILVVVAVAVVVAIIVTIVVVERNKKKKKDAASSSSPQRLVAGAPRLSPEKQARIEQLRAAQAAALRTGALPQRLEMGQPAARAGSSTRGTGRLAAPSAFDEDLPPETGPRGLISGPAAHRLKGAALDSSALFDRKADALDKKDAKIEDMFPLMDPSDKPKNGHEEVAAMYNFANFRAAHDRNSVAGWLRPVEQRQGWRRLGVRADMKTWRETMESLRQQMEGSDVAERFADDIFTPAEGGFLLDFLNDTARSKGLDVDYLGDELGMGSRGSAQLHSAAKHDAAAARHRHSGGHGYDGYDRDGSLIRLSSSGTTSRGRGGSRARGDMTRLSGHEQATLIRDSQSVIPSPEASPSGALAAIKEISKARQLADADGMTLPPPTADQMHKLMLARKSSIGALRLAADKLYGQIA